MSHAEQPGRPALSIIIPTLNEAAQIVEALGAARAAAPGAELIVADGGSADGTPELAAPHARVIAAPRGRARQMNAGAALARGDALLFLHADTRLPLCAAPAIGWALADPAVIGGAFAMQFDEPGPLFRLNAVSTTVRSRLRGVHTGDQAIFVRAAAFRAAGGYPDIPLMEDLALCARLRPHGRLATVLPPVTVSARRHRRHGLIRVVVSGWCYQLLYAAGLSPRVLHRLYYGRWPE